MKIDDGRDSARSSFKNNRLEISPGVVVLVKNPGRLFV